MTPPDGRSRLADSSGDLGYRIAGLVADQEGTDSLALPPLNDVVDVDALEALFRAGRSSGTVTFGYLGHRVVVDAEGTVSLAE